MPLLPADPTRSSDAPGGSVLSGVEHELYQTKQSELRLLDLVRAVRLANTIPAAVRERCQQLAELSHDLCADVTLDSWLSLAKPLELAFRALEQMTAAEAVRQQARTGEIPSAPFLSMLLSHAQLVVSTLGPSAKGLEATPLTRTPSHASVIFERENVGTWLYWYDRDTYVYDTAFSKIWGVPAPSAEAGEIQTLEQLQQSGQVAQRELRGPQFLQTIHPDDLPGVMAVIQKQEATYSLRFRCQRPDGSWRRMFSSTQNVAATEQTPAHRFGVVWDVTEEYQREQSLNLTRRRLEQVLAAGEMGLWVSWPSTLKGWLDRTTCRIFGLECGAVGRDFAGDEFVSLYHPQDRPRILASLSEMRQTNTLSLRLRGRMGKDWSRVVESLVYYQLETEESKPELFGVIWEVTAEVRREEELRNAKERAEAANVAKSNFLSAMSHEIRTPLNAILGFTQLLERDPTLSAEQAKRIRIVESAGRHLLELVNDILDVSKIESGRLELAQQRIDLPAMLLSAVDVFRQRADDKGISLCLVLSPDLPQIIEVDAGKVRQVLANLLSNALKFTTHGSVVVKAAPVVDSENPRLLVTVTDTGVGIGAEDAVNLFRPFEQGRAANQSREGTGLGLAISRKLARLMAGDVTFSSTLGRGSTFQFEFSYDSTSSTLLPATQRNRVVGLAPESKPVLVLVVDDRGTNQELLVSLLEGVGLRACVADNGKNAIAAVAQHKPDLVLMDLHMPVMNGEEAVRVLRGDPAHQKLPIIAVSASVLDYNQARQRRVGFDAFLAKPIHADLLYDLIATFTQTSFTYAPGPEQAVPAHGIGPQATLAQELAALDGQERQTLLGLLNQLDYQGLEDSLKASREISPESQQLLAQLMENFQTATLQRLLSSPDTVSSS